MMPALMDWISWLYARLTALTSNTSWKPIIRNALVRPFCRTTLRSSPDRPGASRAVTLRPLPMLQMT